MRYDSYRLTKEHENISPSLNPIKGLSCPTFFTGHEVRGEVTYPHEDI